MRELAIIMEKLSGLIECPRCGLRNRLGAYRCEFCGWNFGVADPDDWMGQLNDLERLGKDMASSLDDSTASKIEMTMKKPSDVPIRKRKPEEEAEVPLHEELELGDTVAAKPIYEGASPTEEEIAESIPEPYGAEAEPATLKKNVISESIAAVEAVPEAAAVSSFRFKLPFAVNIGILVAGGAALVAALLLVTSGSIDKAFGWILTIIGSFLVVLSVSRLIPTMEKGFGPFRKKSASDKGNLSGAETQGP